MSVDRDISEDARQILIEAGCLVDGHFVLASEQHAGRYVIKDLALASIDGCGALATMMADIISTSPFDAIVAPAVGAIALGALVTSQSIGLRGMPEKMYFIPAEKGKGEHAFDIRPSLAALLVDKRVWVVEDILTSGGSAQKVVEAVRAAGAYVQGCIAIWNRGRVTAAQVGVPRLEALITEPIASWSADECPLCRANVSVNTNVGHGAKFLAARAAGGAPPA